MDGLLLESQEIVDQAILDYQPAAIFMMFSGGNDSRAAWEVARLLKVPVTHFVHGNTRTGVVETTNYVRNFAATTGLKYIEADAGGTYEGYVKRKGFFGVGSQSHGFAYHMLKAEHFRKAAASIRQRRRKFNILFLSGARQLESRRRKRNFTKPINADPGLPSNIWVDIILHWDKQNLVDFLHQCKSQSNPVTDILCRSGECMCGTMQSKAEGDETAYWFPQWGKWRDRMNELARANGFLWQWGEPMGEYEKAKLAGNLELFPDFDFRPACAGCDSRRLEQIHDEKDRTMQ